MSAVREHRCSRCGGRSQTYQSDGSPDICTSCLTDFYGSDGICTYCGSIRGTCQRCRDVARPLAEQPFGKDFASVIGGRRRGMGKRSVRLLDAATKILEEIQPATVRATCYRLFVAGLILNMGKSCTNSVSRLLRLAREQGDIPWAWIVDESREAETVTQWSNPDEIIRAAVKGYRRDYWQDQSYRVECWSEKGTIRGTLGPVLDEYGVTFRVMHGYASATVVNAIAELSKESDKPLIALYVGDWDPSGKHMSDVDLPRRLGQYGGDVRLSRIALTSLDLEPLPSFEPESKRQDPRYQWFTQHVRSKCYELDAMPPPELRARVESSIRAHINLDRWEHARAIERVEVESMQDFHKSWQASIRLKG